MDIQYQISWQSPIIAAIFFKKTLITSWYCQRKRSEDDQRLHYTVAMNAYPNIIWNTSRVDIILHVHQIWWNFENHKRALVTLNYIWCLWLMPNRCLKSCAFWSMFIKNKLVFCPKNDPVVWFKKRKWLKLKVCIKSKRLKWSSARTWSLIQTLKELRK